MNRLKYKVDSSGTHDVPTESPVENNKSFTLHERNVPFKVNAKGKEKVHMIDNNNNGALNDIMSATKKSIEDSSPTTTEKVGEITVDVGNDNSVIGSLSINDGINSITSQDSTSSPSSTTQTVAHDPTIQWKGGKRMSTWRKENNLTETRQVQQQQQHNAFPLWTKPESHTTTKSMKTTRRAFSSKRRRSSINFPVSPSSSSSLHSGLMKTNFSPASSIDESEIAGDDYDTMKLRMKGLGKEDMEYVISPVLVTENDDVASAVSKRLLDIHQISSRLHRSFPWEGLGLHNNNSTGSIGNFLTTRIGFSPVTTPHTLVFSSFYVVPLILLLGVVIAIIWLLCACVYHTMQKIKLALCPGRRANSGEDCGGSSNGNEGRSKKGNKKGNKSSNIDPCSGTSFSDVNKKPEILTPEILEMRRQERLAFLQAECANLEQQLTGLRASLPPQLQNSFEEKSATLTSRASDSDLEYLGASESPPLKRNSISLQDIPQSVIRIRREKELRQIKEEIEYLKNIAQQEKEKIAKATKGLKGSILITQDFELPSSKPGSPNETKVEPLSQHISHLKTQRKLTEIRTELEDLAIQLLHADEIKAKRNSLQELPRTALNIQREQNLITMTNEIQKMKNYKLQKKNVIETALEKTTTSNPKIGTSSADGKKSGSKSFINANESPSIVQDAAAKYTDPEFVHRSSIKRQREQELNRVRVELKDLAYKLNLNPMNYISEDRVRLVPSQSMQSTTSVAGQSYNRSVSTSSALNHV